MKWRLIVVAGTLALLLATSLARAALFLHGTYNPSVASPPVPTQIAPATCPNVLDNTAANTAVCPLTITMSDGSAFTGTVNCITSTLFTIPGCTGVTGISPTSLSIPNTTAQGTAYQFSCTSNPPPCTSKTWSYSNVPTFLTPTINSTGVLLTTNQAPPLTVGSGILQVQAQ